MSDQHENFDLETLSVPAEREVNIGSLFGEKPKRPPRHRRGEQFLKGPIPWNWLRRAMALPGKSLHVSILLWKQAGCRRSRTVPFRAGADGINRKSGWRALGHLRSAGLIAYCGRSGQVPEVTILDVCAPKPDLPQGGEPSTSNYE
jgi:hypothetical protein